MNLQSLTLLFAKITLVFTFIVVIAGSVVRMTGSGMGCPDWPKCFGHFIPPTDASELSFREGLVFEKGQMLIYNDTLWVANEDVVLAGSFSHDQWHKYPKHDYATFNVLHTWVEYINRLATVVYGFPVFILSVCALLMLIRQKATVVFLLALFADIMIGYEIWLGKLVVDGNLKENSITYHMFGSIAIIALLLVLIRKLGNRSDRIVAPIALRTGILVMLVFTFLQIMLGTQVREEVDLVSKTTSDRSVWIDMLPVIFKIHRSFSILIVLFAVWLLIQYKKASIRIRQIDFVFVLLGIELLIGVVLNYFSMPALMQPLHLLTGVILFAANFSALLMMKKE